MWKKFENLVHWISSNPSYNKSKLEFKPFVFTLNGQTLQVMRARENDIANLIFLEANAYNGHSPWAPEIFQMELRKRGSLYLVVYHESTLVGMIGMSLKKEEAHITNITIDPSWQGQGLGTYLMRLMIDFAQNKGCQLMSLEVRIDNEVAKTLYHSFGFVTNFVRPNYYQDVHKDGLNMVLKLTPNSKEGK